MADPSNFVSVSPFLLSLRREQPNVRKNARNKNMLFRSLSIVILYQAILLFRAVFKADRLYSIFSWVQADLASRRPPVRAELFPARNELQRRVGDARLSTLLRSNIKAPNHLQLEKGAHHGDGPCIPTCASPNCRIQLTSDELELALEDVEQCGPRGGFSPLATGARPQLRHNEAGANLPVEACRVKHPTANRNPHFVLQRAARAPSPPSMRTSWTLKALADEVLLETNGSASGLGQARSATSQQGAGRPCWRNQG